VSEAHIGAVAAGRGSIDRADLNALFLIRTVAIIVQALALWLSTLAPEHPLPVIVMGAVCPVFVVASLLMLDRIQRTTAADDAAFLTQILIDIAVLTYLLGLSGGPANPFHNMYVLPLTIAAGSLPAVYVWRTAAAVIACYMFLEFVHLPLPSDRPLITDLVRFAKLSDHVLLATLVSYFVVRMSKGLRQRDQQLAEAHEREIRAGCAITLGSVAAGAAHELATPLSTISTVLAELRKNRGRGSDRRRNLELLQASLAACLGCLKDLRSCGDAWIKGGEAVAADRFLEEVTTRFRGLRPDAYVARVFKRPLPGPLIVPDLALQQAIINLLSNAAFVSPLDITLHASWDGHELVVRVADKGTGISPELAEQLGRVFVTTKPPDAGNGIGLFLTNVTINRLGGRLRLFNAAGGGAVAEIAVPLASLQRKERFNEQFA
jgi:two-component system sensor histidine kinase RegB